MAHSGLALSARSCATGAGGETTACTAAAGFVQVDSAGGPACVPSARSASGESVETADVDKEAPPCTDNARTVIPIASFRIISCPAIGPTQPAKSAISPHRTRRSGLELRVDR